MTQVLGCDISYAARVVDRDGAVVTTLDTLSEVDWYRTLNDTSTASAMATVDPSCCEKLGRIRTWRHDLEVFRDGVFVWSGPIIRVQWSRDSVEIVANDVTAWLTRRVIHQRVSYQGIETSTIATALIDDAFTTHGPKPDVVVAGTSGVYADRAYYTGVGQTMDWLVDLSENGGIDFTAAGRRIIILPDRFAEPVGRLTDTDMPVGLTVTEDGSELATMWHLYGPDGSGVYAAGGGTDDYYGLIERSEQDRSLTTDQSASSAAESRARASRSPSVYIDTQDITLSSETTIPITRLMPGWAVDVTSEATCRTVTERLKITGVRARVNAEGERLSLSVGPLTL